MVSHRGGLLGDKERESRLGGLVVWEKREVIRECLTRVILREGTKKSMGLVREKQGGLCVVRVRER